MATLATITFKNQLTIPSRFIEHSNLKGEKRVLLERRGSEIVIKPFKSNVEELAGSLRKYALKGKSINEIIRLEHAAIKKTVVGRYKNKLKSEGNNLLVIKT